MAGKKKDTQANPKGTVLMSRPFRRIGNAMPKAAIKYFEKKLGFAGIRQEARVWLGIRILFSFVMGGLALFLYLIITNPPPTPENIIAAFGFLLLGFSLSATIFYLLLYFMILDRTSALERILPDFLLLTVSNLRSGMTPFKSFVGAARPEFGALHDEIMLGAAKASSAASLTDALSGMSDYFDSRIFRRTINLFAKGMRSGGQLARLLRASADEVQHIRDLRAELAASTRTYTLFLGFIMVIIMPFLLSISALFVKIFVELQPEYEGIDTEMVGSVPMFSGKIFIAPAEMILISIFTLVLTSFLVSILAGIIKKGSALYGIRYFPIFAIASVLFFFVAHGVLGDILMVFST